MDCFQVLAPFKKPINHQQFHYSLTGSSAQGKRSPVDVQPGCHQAPAPPASATCTQVRHWRTSDFPCISASLLIPSTGRSKREIPPGAENLVPTHLWRQLGRSPSLSTSTSEAGLGKHAWQLAPTGILRGPGDEGLFMVNGWEPSPGSHHGANS